MLKKIHIEFYLLLFLFSGLFKSLFFLLFGNDYKPVPLTIILGVLFISMIFIKKEYDFTRLKNNFKNYIFFILFFIWAFISISYSSSEKYSWFKIIALGTNYLAFFGVLITKKIDIKLFSKYFIVFTILFSTIFLIINPNTNEVNTILIEYFNYKYIKGWYLALGKLLVVNMILLFSFKNKNLKIYLSIIFLNIIILLGGRFSIIFAFSLLILIFIYLAKNKYVTRKLIRQFSISLLIVSSINGAFYISSNSYKSLINRSLFRFKVLTSTMDDIQDLNNNIEFTDTQKMTQNITLNKKINSKPKSINKTFVDTTINNNVKTSKNMSFITRFKYLKFSLKKISENPKNFILGYGLGSLSYEYRKIDERMYPHNMFLEILFELGLIGLILILAFFYTNINIFKNIYLDLAFLSTLILFTHAMKSSSFIDLRILFALLAISIFHNKKAISKAKKT